MTRILLADDHRLVREGLRSCLEHYTGMEVVGEADNGRDTVTLVQKLEPDVVLMDVQMPELNGIEATRAIKSSHPDTQVVMLSMYSDNGYVTRALEAGASGFVAKECAFNDLAAAIQSVERGDRYFSDGLECDGSDRDLLSAREREVLQMLAEGNSCKQIAGRLGLSSKTVNAHQRSIMHKLGLNSVALLTKYAIREGLTPAPK